MEVRIAIMFLAIVLSTQAVNFLPSIQWTPDNPIFNNLKGEARKVNIDDEIRIWCPKFYTQGIKTTYQLHQSKLYFALYKVETKEEYENCDARKGKRLLYCNDPSGKSTKDTEERQIVFMSNPISDFNDPYPAGKMYYFIGTSGGTEGDINRKVGGKCQSQNMKFAIYVCTEQENCSVDVLNGGWSLWRVNEETGLCERNCSNPAPQNGGFPCQGPDKMECSKIISGRKRNPTTEREATTERTTTVEEPTKETTQETTKGSSRREIVNTTKATKRDRIQHTTWPTTVPSISETTNSEITESVMDALDDEQEPEEGDSDDVTLSMKGAVLTFVGLFILGCVVGIVQVLVILHVRSKRSVKQPEPQNPVSPV